MFVKYTKRNEKTVVGGKCIVFCMVSFTSFIRGEFSVFFCKTASLYFVLKSLIELVPAGKLNWITAQKVKFSIKDFFSKCDKVYSSYNQPNLWWFFFPIKTNHFIIGFFTIILLNLKHAASFFWVSYQIFGDLFIIHGLRRPLVIGKKHANT